MRIPTGLRSHTPISHTASTPNAAIASHSSDGTVPRVIVLLYWLLKSLSHTQVLISYMMGRAGHSAFKGYFSSVKMQEEFRSTRFAVFRLRVGSTDQYHTIHPLQNRNE